MNTANQIELDEDMAMDEGEPNYREVIFHKPPLIVSIITAISVIGILLLGIAAKMGRLPV